MATRMPLLFVPHGAGPLPILGDPAHAELVNCVKNEVMQGIPEPKAILIISAHWEENEPTVQACPQPSMLYDYNNFPPESYKFQYPAPGNPTLAQRIRDLLQQAGFEKVGNDTERGFDHGAFVPLMIMLPNASIPCVELSILTSLDPTTHIKLGKALAPLRDEGVLILGSGMSFHNMPTLRQMIREGQGEEGIAASKTFSKWLTEAVTNTDPNKREQMLIDWENAPHARFCHAREEHLIPLHVIAGAAGDDVGRVDREIDLTGQSLLSISFGRANA
eukprot:c9867_g1_i1.p1 GENE.c9867_g1_i1~~c9867_g1_i1.p1  ORF type:complete len:276 (-),score=56.91 c9867_g1_i1:69-896(-)